MSHASRTLLQGTFVLLAYAGITWLSQRYLITEEALLSSFSSLPRAAAERFTRISLEFRWLGYVFLLLWVLLKWLLVTLCLQAGLVVSNQRAPFASVWRLVVRAEWVFVLLASVRLVRFLLIRETFTLEDLQLFYPLSALNLFDQGSLEPWWVYPFQVINVFEVIYWVVLARGLGRITGSGFGRSLNLVATGYGTGLLIWVLTVVLVSLNLNPA